MKIAFIADPIERLNPQSDTSLALLREALGRGHEAHWVLSSGVGLSHTQIELVTRRCGSCADESLPELGSAGVVSAESFDAILIRKDPPFNSSYVKLCWLLSLCENRTWMLNPPSSLLRYHEKLVPLEALLEGDLLEGDVIPTFYRSLNALERWMGSAGEGEVVSKPFFGFGGRAVQKLPVASVHSVDSTEQAKRLFQPFHDAILKEGDRRVFLLGGKYLGQVVRMPKEGDFISNFAQGGRAEHRKMSPTQLEVIARLGKFLKKKGIHLAGADLIGNKLSEVNITSPTGLQAMRAMDGVNYAEKIVHYIEEKASV